jgi:hypothetical protein
VLLLAVVSKLEANRRKAETAVKEKEPMPTLTAERKSRRGFS